MSFGRSMLEVLAIGIITPILVVPPTLFVLDKVEHAISDEQTEVSLIETRLIDADTIEGTVEMEAEAGEPLYWNVSTKHRPITIQLVNQRIRVHGVDAYERSTIEGKAAKVAVQKLLVGKKVKLTPRGKDNFGRLLAIVTLVDDSGKETVLADWLIEHGHGVPYEGR